MNSPTESELLWSQRARSVGWQIVRTIMLGVVAIVLAMYGQDALLQARPIFPLIDQNYVLWQIAYVLILLIIGLAWAAAMLQKVRVYQDCTHNARMQRRIDEERQLRIQRALDAKEARAARQAEIDMALTSPAINKNKRSGKFDY